MTVCHGQALVEPPKAGERCELLAAERRLVTLEVEDLMAIIPSTNVGDELGVGGTLVFRPRKGFLRDRWLGSAVSRERLDNADQDW